jgi:hypothetical protein
MNQDRCLSRKIKDKDANLPDGRSPVLLDARVEESIGKALQAHYDDVARMPLPESFLSLLAELAAKRRSET